MRSEESQQRVKGKTGYQIFHRVGRSSVFVCVAVIVMFDLNVFQLESGCYSLSFNRHMLKYFLVLDQVFPSSTKEVVYHK